MPFTIRIEPEVIEDIQNGIDWYNDKQSGLGKKFYTDVKATLETIRSSPFFQIRYDNVRCIPLDDYPFMVHYTVDNENEIITIRAIFNTSRNPEIWKDKR